jgi:hypothetical protein
MSVKASLRTAADTTTAVNVSAQTPAPDHAIKTSDGHSVENDPTATSARSSTEPVAVCYIRLASALSFSLGGGNETARVYRAHR